MNAMSARFLLNGHFPWFLCLAAFVPNAAFAWACGDTLVDTRDSKEYPTVLIGEQCWMAENLDYDSGCTGVEWVDSTDVGWCGYYEGGPYENEGLLYQWSAAMAGSTEEESQGVCPEGWHVPSDAELHILEYGLWDGITGACDQGRFTWDCNPAGDKLKKAGLCEGRTPCGTSGFNKLLSGMRLRDGGYGGRGGRGFLWSSTLPVADYSWYWTVEEISSTIRQYYNYKDYSFSVRCIRDPANTVPSLTSVSASPSPIKGGDTLTITPAGQGDADSDTLYYYCNELGSATSENTVCSEGNTSYSSPYSGMTCTYTPTGNATRTVYCRTYDGTDYSAEKTAVYTVDATAPSIGLTTLSGFTIHDGYIKGTGTIVGGEAADPGGSGIDGATCEYTTDGGNTWGVGVWDTDRCVKTSVTIVDETAYTFNTRVKDAVGNQGTGTATIAYTGDTQPPTPASVIATPHSSGAIITWETVEAGSTRLHYGRHSTPVSLTEETNTSPRTTIHSVNLTSLVSCARYTVEPLSTDAIGNTGTGSSVDFTTTGCQGDATVLAYSGALITTSSTGTVILSGTNTGFTLLVPPNVSTGSLHFQIKQLSEAEVLATTSSPAGKTHAGRFYHLQALSGSTVSVTSFSGALTLTMEYTNADIAGLQESALVIYRYDTAWHMLDNCTVDTTVNTVTCTTTNFSVFGLFGSAASAESTPAPAAESTSAATQASGGRRGSQVGMAARIATAQSALLARYAGEHLQEVAVENELQHAAAWGRPSLATIAKQRGRLYAVIGEQAVLYRDVSMDAWFTPYVAMLIEENIAQGYRDETGKPTGEFGVVHSITYAEVLKMALETAGYGVTGLPPPRNISARGTWAQAYVAKAEEMGITVFPSTLNVHTFASRGEVVQTILEVLKLPIAKQTARFQDVQSSHPHAHAIATAAFYGFIAGDTDAEGNPLNTFRPDDHINRAEVAKIIALVKAAME